MQGRLRGDSAYYNLMETKMCCRGTNFCLYSSITWGV